MVTEKYRVVKVGEEYEIQVFDQESNIWYIGFPKRFMQIEAAIQVAMDLRDPKIVWESDK